MFWTEYREHQPPSLAFRYVYDHLGENHDNILKELVASISTFAVTTLWLGPCQLIYIWSLANCFGLNFELWVQKFFQLGPFAKLEVRSCKGHGEGSRGLELEDLRGSCWLVAVRFLAEDEEQNP